MPLSDLFDKPLRNQPPKNHPFGSPELQKRRYEAALEFATLFQERTPLVDGRPHAGTVLSVVARLAGSSLFRALNDPQDLEAGTVVLSEEVNEAWPKLMELFAFYCKQNGTDITGKPFVTTFPEAN